MKREEYASKLGAVTDLESLFQLVWAADDHAFDLEAFDFEAEGFDPVKLARLRQAQVMAEGFEFEVNEKAEELRAYVLEECDRAAEIARREKLAELLAA